MSTCAICELHEAGNDICGLCACPLCDHCTDENGSCPGCILSKECDKCGDYFDVDALHNGLCERCEDKEASDA